MFSFKRVFLVFLLLPLTMSAERVACADELRIGTFSADITVPLGHRCMGILPTKALRIDDPLEARGCVLLSDAAPVVIVALDWCEVRNGAYDLWRERLAAAAATAPERVLVCSLHQHDAPVTDNDAQAYLDRVGMENELFDVKFQDECIARTSAALKQAVSDAQPVTHIGIGQAEVAEVASNRRVQHADGSVRFDRYSASGGDPVFAEALDGEIDPFLKSISFWNGEEQLAVVSSYATHPMSYYGKGGVSADFVGLARRQRQLETPGAMQIYLTGCSGDVTAGKYNKGTPASRLALAERLHRGMTAAAEATSRHPISQFAFRSEQLLLPFHDGNEFRRDAMMNVLQDESATEGNRILAAMGLSSLDRVERGQPIDLPCLDFGVAQLVVLPGEAFVGYQLLAQEIRPDSFVLAAGYGECWTGYIPTRRAFADGFDHGWRWVSMGCEEIIRQKLESVLKAAE